MIKWSICYSKVVLRSVQKPKMVFRLFIWVSVVCRRHSIGINSIVVLINLSAAQGDHVDAARILLYYKSTLVDDVSSVSEQFEMETLLDISGGPFRIIFLLCTSLRIAAITTWRNFSANVEPMSMRKR